MVAFSDTNLHPFWTDAFRNELTDTVFYGAANRGNLWPLAFFLDLYVQRDNGKYSKLCF